MPDIDAAEIKEEVIKRAQSELQLRISKGYRGIDLGAIDLILNELLRELKIK